MTGLPVEARRLLEGGTLCYVAARAGDGPHLTPVVFVLEGERVWITSSRGSRKARMWRRDPTAAGMVRASHGAVTFRGRVTLYDVLDPDTWPAALARSPALVRAWTRFTLKNLRYFAGYARDAHRVPLSWTPPGRIFLSVELEAGAALGAEGEVVASWGSMGTRVRSRAAYRAGPASRAVDEAVPGDVRRLLGESGEGALALATRTALTVLPVRWARHGREGAVYAALSLGALALAGSGPEPAASLVADRASAWRAARMAGLQLRGGARVFVPGRLRSGRRALLARAADLFGEEPEAVVRLRPDTAVWWRGWSSGTVRRP